MLNDNKLSKDYLPGFPSIILYQHKKMFRVNTDTSLLGHYLKVKDGDKVLDIGTNNGALLLYASLFRPSLLVGLDINKEALEIARLNLEANNIKKFELENINIKDYKCIDKFDVIVSNPPYFNTLNQELKNNNEYLKIAKHEEFLSLNILLEKVSKCLKEDGHFYLIYPYFRFEEVKINLKKYNLFIEEYCIVRDENKNNNHVILYSINKCDKSCCKQGETIIIKR